MSRMLKKQLYNMIDTMLNANSAYIAMLGNNQYQEIMTLSEQLQQAAVQIGTLIEKNWENHEEAVQILEQYCEHLYEITQFQGMEESMIIECVHQLAENLVQVSRIVKEQLDDRLEILFCPYKAAMWDSLESVYLSAMENKECDAKVMPIPYYDKNPDGSFGTLHYEQELFDHSLRLVSYTEYLLDEHYPDVIFIHNPYDAANTITSIAPQFYASNLRMYTDKLIYIPYFVHVDEYVHSHFCALPGIIYADYIVLQSEKVRQQYITYYKQAFAELGKEQYASNAEQKFVALGSPKFDHVKSYDLTDIGVPEEWKKLILIGSKKKTVVLYNTHINNLMSEYVEDFLKKIQRVLDVFQQRKDVVLLWRPHPLSIATLEAKNPAYLQQYCDIVEKYRIAGWGIYDDSADMERAVTLSDAYYGDNSSLIALFHNQEKPVMIEQLYE